MSNGEGAPQMEQEVPSRFLDSLVNAFNQSRISSANILMLARGIMIYNQPDIDVYISEPDNAIPIENQYPLQISLNIMFILSDQVHRKQFIPTASRRLLRLRGKAAISRRSGVYSRPMTAVLNAFEQTNWQAILQATYSSHTEDETTLSEHFEAAFLKLED